MRATTIEVQTLLYGQNTRDQIRVIVGSNACDQIALCAFHTFLVEVQTNAGYIHATHA